ncbi:MAG: hypothetical protein KKE57_04905 [Proteobacteria bacterium]|nr:hypothetical protein [Pseudomonadota bacterium]
MAWDLEASLYKTTVVFDEALTSIQKIVATLARGGYKIQGDPEFRD